MLEWRKAPRLVPDDKEIGKELDSGVLFEYVAFEGTCGDCVRENQGRALAYLNALVASRSVETDESATEGSEGQALEGLAGRGKEAVSSHLGLQTSTPPAQLALDEKVTKELERAQEAATLAGKKLGVDLPPGHTLVGKSGTPFGRISATSRSPAPVPTGVPQAPRTLEPLVEAMTGLESDDDSLAPRRASSEGGALQSQLVRAAKEFPKKRASAQVDDGLCSSIRDVALRGSTGRRMLSSATLVVSTYIISSNICFL